MLIKYYYQIVYIKCIGDGLYSFVVFLLLYCKITCLTHNGESVIDYLISSENNFSSLSSMIMHEYSEFSNNTPISFSLKLVQKGQGRQPPITHAT